MELMEMVTTRPSFVPYTVSAHVDDSTKPSLLLQVDKSQLPRGTTLDKTSGDMTIALTENPGTIIGVKNTSKDDADMSSAFAISGNTIYFRPRFIDLNKLVA